MKTFSDIKELLGLKPSHDYRNIFDHVQFLIRERDDALQLRDDALQLRDAYNSNVKDWRELCGYFNLPVSTLSDVMSAIDTMRTERDEARRLDGLVITDMDGNTVDWELSEGIVEIPHSTQPQLSEIRYVLHGDIQPCSVLYSDDTTTLLRLDEGDMMLETDTIEWSDSVTYRCQELLKVSGLNKINLVRVSGHLAQLVRDERILLNDDALETSGTVDLKVDSDIDAPDIPFMRYSPLPDRGVSVVSCVSCANVYSPSLDLWPQCHTPSLDLCPQCHTPNQER
ncbi:putative coil containing protein [Vibrio phage 382E49-1]|nr:putative coil containing protein [Vibrio phage 382E49-1]